MRFIMDRIISMGKNTKSFSFQKKIVLLHLEKKYPPANFER